MTWIPYWTSMASLSKQDPSVGTQQASVAGHSAEYLSGAGIMVAPMKSASMTTPTTCCKKNNATAAGRVSGNMSLVSRPVQCLAHHKEAACRGPFVISGNVIPEPCAVVQYSAQANGKAEKPNWWHSLRSREGLQQRVFELTDGALHVAPSIVLLPLLSFCFPLLPLLPQILMALVKDYLVDHYHYLVVL